GAQDLPAAFAARAVDLDHVVTSIWHVRGLALHAHDLPQLVHDVDEIGLGCHYLIDGLVGHRRLVDHGRVLAALDARGRLDVIFAGDPPLGLAAGHRAARAVAARAERLATALAAHDEALRAHRARDDA